jgi:polyphosphate kinase
MKKYKYFDRELSWLSFNHRVLQEAKDPSVPLHEKIKFMAIFSSNLDEFFRVRVASLRSLLSLKEKVQKDLKINPRTLLNQIQTTVDQHQKDLGNIFRNSVIPELEKNNIFLQDGSEFDEKQMDYAHDYFRYEVLPYLRPSLLVRNKITVFLQNKVLYFVVRLISKNNKKKSQQKAVRSSYAIVEIPTMHLPRYIRIPSGNEKSTFIILDDLMRLFLNDIFPGYIVKDVYSVKLTRDAQMYIDDEFSGNLLEKIKRGITQRKTGVPSRFLYDENMPVNFLGFIRDTFTLQKEDLIAGGRYHNFSDFISFPRLGSIALQDKKLPAIKIPAVDKASTIFSILSKNEILTFYPYHSFEYVIRFIKEAADDPSVIDISITLYRGAPDSQVIRQLIRAANAGKSITVFVELKARFDEESNIIWAQVFEQKGIHVLYSIPGLKVHSKLCLISRKENNRVKRYAYMATGNFNEKTAKIYSDFGFFTGDGKLTKEVKMIFDHLNNFNGNKNFRHLFVAPFTMRENFYNLIDQEIANAAKGKAASIDIKLNSLEDKKIIRKLYEASNAGVKIRIIVRGICCLIPGIKNMSENIQVISIIDRYLEHARMYIFHNGGQTKIFLASADWMKRNLSRRIEVAFPIYSKHLQTRLIHIFNIQWQDNAKARIIDSKQQNHYKERTEEILYRSQYETYEFLKSEKSL